MLNPPQHHLLMVDDDVKLCHLIRDYFGPMGFDMAFAHTGPDGLRQAKERRFDAVILDVMLPGLDGFEVLRQLRMISTAPVVMLTGRGEETDRIVGLEMGADDYVPKTSSTRELLARIRAVLRRTSTAVAQDIAEQPIVVQDLAIYPESRMARRDGESLPLTPVELGLLTALARARGRVMSREQLLQHVSARELDVFDRSIDVHISSLRKKLGDDRRNPRFIQTVRAAGYRLASSEGN